MRQFIASQILRSTSVVMFAPLLSLAIEAVLTPLFSARSLFVHILVNQHFPQFVIAYSHRLPPALSLTANYVGSLIFWIKNLVQKTVSTVLLVPGKANHVDSFFLILRGNKGHTLCLFNKDHLAFMSMINEIFNKILFNGITLLFMLRLRYASKMNQQHKTGSWPPQLYKIRTHRNGW